VRNRLKRARSKGTEALDEFARSPNQKLLFLPLETAVIAGTLGGIAKLVRDAGIARPAPAAVRPRTGPPAAA